MNRPIVAVDAMGGDRAPGAVVAGSVDAARALGIAVVLVGDEPTIRAELDRHPAAAKLPLSVVHAPEWVAMDESPVAALRRKPRASIKVAAELVAQGAAHAVLSAGHTGATLMAARMTFGLIEGVDRPALAVTVPTRTGVAVLLDAGATVECRAEHLEQFARMGGAYAAVASALDRPAIGLLSIGEEAGKGTDLIREAYAALRAAPINFIGNVEAQELFSGRADVVVCDGFTGNIALKVGEGLVETIEHMWRHELETSPLDERDRARLADAIHRFKQRLDYAESGGAPLLGVRGLALVAHGRSSPHAIRSGIAMAARLAEGDIVRRLSEALAMPSPLC